MLANKKLKLFAFGCVAIIFFFASSVITYNILVVFQRDESIQIPLPKPFVVYSGSMAPAIKTASLILSLPSNSYQQGDIVTFAPKGNTDNLITHRIEAKLFPGGVESKPVYKTSGDANEDFDRWEVKEEQIIGKVVLTIPYLGYAVDFAKKPYGFILLVIIPATIVIYEELKLLKREASKHLSKLKSKIKKTKPPNNINFVYANKEKGLSKIYTLLPIIGAFIVFIGVANAFFSDSEASTGNLLSMAETFDESPTATPTSEPQPTPAEALLVINEFMVNPLEGKDWVELYSNIDIDISNYVLDDEGTTTDMAVIPSSTMIGPSTSKYFVVEVSNRLNKSSDTIYFYTPSKETLVDSYTYSSAPADDETIGRDPDGTGSFNICTLVTKGSSNTSYCP